MTTAASGTSGFRRFLAYQAAEIRRSFGRGTALRVDTNNACNLRCIYCVTSRQERPAFMPVHRFEKLARLFFCRSRYVSLSCGTEPLLTPDFDRYLEILGGYGVPTTHFITNGQLLSEGTIRAAIRTNLSWITLSIDGEREETYRAIRGASLERVLGALRLVDQLKRAAGSTTPRVRVQFTFFRLNASEVVRFVEQHHTLVQEFVFSHLSPAGPEGYDHPLLERISREEYDEIRSRLAVAASALGVACRTTFNEFRQDPTFARWCPISPAFRFVKYDGALMMCDKKVYGNVFDEDLYAVERRINDAFGRENPRCLVHCSQRVAKVPDPPLVSARPGVGQSPKVHVEPASQEREAGK